MISCSPVQIEQRAGLGREGLFPGVGLTEHRYGAVVVRYRKVKRWQSLLITQVRLGILGCWLWQKGHDKSALEKEVR